MYGKGAYFEGGNKDLYKKNVVYCHYGSINLIELDFRYRSAPLDEMRASLALMHNNYAL